MHLHPSVTFDFVFSGIPTKGKISHYDKMELSKWWIKSMKLWMLSKSACFIPPPIKADTYTVYSGKRHKPDPAYVGAKRHQLAR